MFCSNCGEENNDDSNFCKKCGTPLNDTEISEQEYDDDRIKNKRDLNKSNNINQNSNSKIIVIAIVAISICLLFAGTIVMSNSNTDSDSTINNIINNSITNDSADFSEQSLQTVTVGGINFNTPDDFEIVNNTIEEHFPMKAFDQTYDVTVYNMVLERRNESGYLEKIIIYVYHYANSYEAEQSYRSGLNLPESQPHVHTKVNNKEGYGLNTKTNDVFMYLENDKEVDIQYKGPDENLIWTIVPND